MKNRNNKGKPWTAEDDAWLKANASDGHFGRYDTWKHEAAEACAEVLGRTPDAVAARLAKFNDEYRRLQVGDERVDITSMSYGRLEKAWKGVTKSARLTFLRRHVSEELWAEAVKPATVTLEGVAEVLPPMKVIGESK